MASARFLLLCALLSLANALHRKHLAGPPEEFSNFQIPSPDTVASEARSAQFEMIFEQTSSGSHSWSVSLPVDSDELFSFNLFSPVANSLKISLTDPTGAQVDLSSHTHTGELASFPIGLESIPGINYLFEKPFPKGTYTLTAESVEDISGRVGTSNEADGVVFFYNESPVKAHTYLNTYSLHLGGKIGLVTRLTDDQDGLAQPRALKDVVTKAVMEVREPNGVEEVVQMHDDGMHDDGLANDGIFGGYIPASQTGMYRASAFLEGADSNGNNLVRSTQHLLPIVSEDLTLSGSAYAVSKDVEHVDILLAVNVNAGADQTYKAYAEVWGTSVSGEQIPICWVAGMTDVFEFSGNDYLALELNTNWVIKAGAVAPYTLKNVYVQDVDVFVPITQLAEIPVNVELATFPTVSAPRDIEITREMREGVFPASLLNATRATAAPSLLLVHGYCSNVNPWEKYGSDFTDATFFLEPSASLTNEKFASLVAAYAENIGMTSWSGIGHSQGGIVLTHLKNYYFTGMDLATGGRLIQSVGTPYQGNTGAGSAANLIKIFGFGCGENFDLTKDGSTLWLTGITPETKKEIFYYTTTYKQGNLFGDYCNMAVNLVLKWPNDGTSELALTSLSGATNLGNKEKWCHTVDMSYDPQYYDHDRNKEMNTRAAR